MSSKKNKRIQIHLINPLYNASGGNEWETLILYEKLKQSPDCDVTLWSEFEPEESLAEQYPIKRINWKLLKFPKKGVFVFLGVYYYIGRWINYAKPNRVILHYNTFHPTLLKEKLKHLSRKKDVELVYCSKLIKEKTQKPGLIFPSPIDLTTFNTRSSLKIKESGIFTIGRLSRDIEKKHNKHDLALYEQMAANGCKIRIMGGTCLTDKETHPNIDLFPSNIEPAAQFIRSLDCFFYRTDPSCTEAFGRIIPEAMACGIPVVCENRGGYTDLIEHNKNGFLFETNEEALQLLENLRTDADLRARVGNEARKSMEKIYSEEETNRIIRYYVKYT